MRTRLLIIIALAFGSSAADAQSSVTLYGVIDEFVQFANVGGKANTVAMGSSGQWASRIGFRGSEDIGGGNSINFVLENGFVPTSGALVDPTSLFNRQAWIGASGGWGETRLGRLNSPVYLTEARLDAFGAVTQASGMNNFSTFVVRTSNTLAYISPTLAGLQASAYFGLGVNGGFRTPGSNYQFSVTYDMKGFAAAYATQGVWNNTGTTLDRATFASASYTYGPGALYLGFHRSQWSDVRVDVRAYSVSFRYTFSPALYVSAGYARLVDATSQGNDASEYAALLNYALSKRTNIYAALSYIDNQNKSNKTLAGAVNAGIPLAYAGANPKALQLGIAHKF
jgi:predicted porin